MKGFKKLTPIEEAQRVFLNAVTHVPGVGKIPIQSSVGRFLARDVVSHVDVPPSTEPPLMDTPSGRQIQSARRVQTP